MSDPNTPTGAGVEDNVVDEPTAADEVVAKLRAQLSTERAERAAADERAAQAAEVEQLRAQLAAERAQSAADLAAIEERSHAMAVELRERRAADTAGVAVGGELPPIELPDVEPGDRVEVVYLDPAEGVPTEVREPARVVDVVDMPGDRATGRGGGPAVVVAWLDRAGTSHPIPLDHRHHGRADAPRVEVL